MGFVKDVLVFWKQSTLASTRWQKHRKDLKGWRFRTTASSGLPCGLHWHRRHICVSFVWSDLNKSGLDLEYIVSAPDGQNEQITALGDIWGYYWRRFGGYLRVFGRGSWRVIWMFSGVIHPITTIWNTYNIISESWVFSFLSVRCRY